MPNPSSSVTKTTNNSKNITMKAAQKKPKILFMLFLFMSFVCINLIFYYAYKLNIKSIFTFHILPNIPSNNKPKRILLYTTWFGSKAWWEQHSGYHLENCGVSNCIITNNKSLIDRSDAVMFHGRDMPSPEELRNQSKTKDQIWIWSVLESPVHIDSDLKLYNNLFDWTGTYSLQSELFLPYFYPIELQPEDPRPQVSKNFAHGKSRMVLATISNCVPTRIEMVKKLKEHVSFDLFGKCSNHIPQTFNGTCKRITKECHSKYKFYFAMENSFCEDYVTEKFYENGLLMGAVPIVFGGPNGPDFKNKIVAPPNSYINVLDFKDMKSLGDYLNYLNSNDTEYNEYHAWRYTHKIRQGLSMCEVCQKLWNPPKTKTGINISDFYSREKHCVEWQKLLFNFLS